ncbi:MAG: PilZ domain-containing protein, partial [Planctomycetota bacterium]
MERRRDYRIGLCYELTLTEEQDRKVWSDLTTRNVSATGLSFESREPHRMCVGDRFEVRLLAQVDGRTTDESMVLSTQATMIRSGPREGALVFDA